MEITIIRITDNGGKTCDRYTIYFSDDTMLMLSDNPLSPQGVCMSDNAKPEYIECDEGIERQFSQLPFEVQTAVQRYMHE
ncbi:MAG TPA: hypothetical protein ENH82_13720 [bacterium]|nr:hypothetical protein [bacterium]